MRVKHPLSVRRTLFESKKKTNQNKKSKYKALVAAVEIAEEAEAEEATAEEEEV
jgi:hypothetical protein